VLNVAMSFQLMFHSTKANLMLPNTKTRMNTRRFNQQLADVVGELKVNRSVEALQLAKSLVRDFPNRSDAHHAIVKAYAANGDKKNALLHAEQAHQLDPEHPGITFLLGRLYLDFNLYEFAAPLLRDAFAKAPNSMLIHWALANYEIAINDGFKAVEHYNQALQIGTPDKQQRQALNKEKALALEAINDRIAADQIYSELQEDDQESHANLLIQRGDLRLNGLDSPLHGSIQESLASNTLTVEQRSELLRVQGNMHDDAKQFDKAYELWTRSRSLKQTGQSTLLANHKLDSIEHVYSKQLLEEFRAFGSPSEKPLFIMGMPRSGTTLVEQILAAHNEVTTIGELGRMSRLQSAFRKMALNNGPESTMREFSQRNAILEMADEYLHFLEIVKPGNSRFVLDKTPFNFVVCGYVNLCFPNAKFIHCNRHPADSFVSAYQNKMNQQHDYSYGQVPYVDAYMAKLRLIRHWKSIFPDKIFELKYEQLVEEPRKVVAALLDFLGLDWEENCLKFFEKKTTVKTFSRDQVRSAVYTSSKERWRNYEKHLGPLFATLQENNFDYHRDVEDSTKRT
jgi:tetratricopeptide (TPR) repeat protein